MKQHAARGWARYAHILRHIYDKAATSIDLARRHGMCQHTASRLVSQLHTLKLAHVEHWKPIRQGAPLPAIRFGGETMDAPRPLTRRGAVSLRTELTGRRAQPDANLIAFASIIRTLDEKAHTIDSLAAETGCSREGVRKLLKTLHELRCVFVERWLVNFKGSDIACYALGFDLDDAPPRAKFTRTQICARYRFRQRMRRLAPAGQATRPQAANDERQAA